MLPYASRQSEQAIDLFVMLGGMAPGRRGEIARLGVRAVVAGTLANLTSAAIVGLFVG